MAVDTESIFLLQLHEFNTVWDLTVLFNRSVTCITHITLNKTVNKNTLTATEATHQRLWLNRQSTVIK